MTHRSGVFHCDECPEHIDTEEPDNFEAATAAMKAAGWRTFKGPDKQWAHSCPLCVSDFAWSQRRR